MLSLRQNSRTNFPFQQLTEKPSYTSIPDTKSRIQHITCYICRLVPTAQGMWSNRPFIQTVNRAWMLLNGLGKRCLLDKSTAGVPHDHRVWMTCCYQVTVSQSRIQLRAKSLSNGPLCYLYKSLEYYNARVGQYFTYVNTQYFFNVLCARVDVHAVVNTIHVETSVVYGAGCTAYGKLIVVILQEYFIQRKRLPDYLNTEVNGGLLENMDININNKRH